MDWDSLFDTSDASGARMHRTPATSTPAARALAASTPARPEYHQQPQPSQRFDSEITGFDWDSLLQMNPRPQGQHVRPEQTAAVVPPPPGNAAATGGHAYAANPPEDAREVVEDRGSNEARHNNGQRKDDVTRERRIMKNRASAERSRQRKQAYVEELEMNMASALFEKQVLQTRFANLLQHVKSCGPCEGAHALPFLADPVANPPLTPFAASQDDPLHKPMPPLQKDT